MRRANPLRSMTLAALGLALAFPAFGQEEKGKAEETRRVEVEGVSFEVPKSWESKRPGSAMQKQVLEVAPAAGDSEPARLTLYVFPGGAGTVEANVERWRRQFTDEEGEAPEVETKTVKGKGVEVTRVETAGTYKDPFAGGGPQEDFRLLGAIVTDDRAGYFFKMIGPDKTMKAAESAFDAMVKSIEVMK
jgi:hypothetical protein